MTYLTPFANFQYDITNPFAYNIQNSQMAVDTIIQDFEKVYHAGMDPNATFQQILTSRHLSMNDFTDPDMNRLERKITSIYKSKMNNEYTRR